MSSSPSKNARPALLGKTINALPSPTSRGLASSADMEKISDRIAPASPPAIAGQKRSIDQVDIDHHRSGSANSSFNQVRREDEFYIYDEATQSSMELDKEVSFLPPPELIHDVHAPKGHSSQESTSMSSLLNFSFESENNLNLDKHNTSTNSHTTSKSHTERTKQTPSSVPTEPEARKLFIQQKASILRKRVQTAMKSIQDHGEIDRRVSEFEAQTRERIRMYFPNSPESTADDSPAPLDGTENVDNQGTTKADSTKPVSPKSPKRPMAYSARIAATAPSSPPMSTTGDGESRMDIDADATAPIPAMLAADRHPETPTSPPQQNGGSSSNTEDPIIVDRNLNCSVEKMIAKARKGEAVDGLLKLMKTTADYDGLDEWKSR